MSEIAKRLRDRRLNLVSEMRGLIDAATENNRDFSVEESGRLSAIDEEIDRLDERLKGVLDQEQRAKDADDAFDNLLGTKHKGGGDPAARGGDAAPDTSAELRKFFRGEAGRSFDVLPPRGQPVDFRALSKLTATAGANTVPTSFYNQLVAHLIEVSGVMQASPTVLNTSSGESLQIPKTTAHSSGAIVAEAGTIGSSEPTFGQITLGAFKYGDLMQISRELITDTGVDLEGYLAMQVGRALGNALGAHLVTGSGTGQPRGIVTDATSGVTGATVAGGAAVIGAPIADNLIDLQFSVISPYRASSSCYWVCRDATLANVRKLKDSTGQYLWQPSLQVGVPDMLLGKPIVTDPFVAAVGTGAKSILFGDFSQYFVRMVGGLRFERSDDFAFDKDLVTYRCLLRADAALVDLTGSVKFFTGNTA